MTTEEIRLEYDDLKRAYRAREKLNLKVMRQVSEDIASLKIRLQLAQRNASAPVWTSAKPTKPGWYWMKPKNSREYPPYAFITEVTQHLLDSGDISNHRMWCGPLAPPKEGAT